MKLSLNQLNMHLIRTIALFCLGLWCMALSAQAEDLYTENFESYNLGTLQSQGGWAGAAAAGVVTGFGSDTTKVVGNATDTSTPVPTNKITLSWGANTKGSFSFDTYYEGATNAGYAGIGKGPANCLGFYLSTATISFRSGPVSGAQTAMVLANGASTVATAGKWYNVTANFTLTNNTITDVWLTNLTDGGAAVQLYFGTGTNTYVYTTDAGDESTWNTAVMRLPKAVTNGGTVRQIDNIQVSGRGAKKLSLVVLH